MFIKRSATDLIKRLQRVIVRDHQLRYVRNNVNAGHVQAVVMPKKYLDHIKVFQ